ncbi:MAG: DUF3824 domain-containing protein [Candidatus Saccharibacteria bacterium]|nr:DUF3824 domain-containing protein [Candidatus Saccharibacteria bacterium]
MNPPKQDFSITLGQINPNEKLLAVIKRHPFGIVKLYVQMLVGVVFAGGLIMVLLPQLISREDNPSVYVGVGIVAVIIIVFLIFLLAVATVIYRRNKLVVTSETITQTLQLGLFNKKISQLAVSNIEDVTAQKSGFFPTVLNYSRLLIETAGEQENFYFDYCPSADHYAKLILETRQAFLSGREFEFNVQNRGQAGSMPQNGAQQQPNLYAPAGPAPGQYAQPASPQYPDPSQVPAQPYPAAPNPVMNPGQYNPAQPYNQNQPQPPVDPNQVPPTGY